ncbi:MAG: hypothetical protein PHR96_03590 [Clostridia bacterium]|nr:hypothetical protein [Clostridia bacterium]
MQKEGLTNFNYYLQYFSLLEERVENISKYISIEKDNLQTYSVVLSSIIQDACSVVNGICVDLCKKHSICKTKYDMKDFKFVFIEYYRSSFGNGVLFSNYKIFPWEKISINIEKSINDIPSPIWWNDYNAIKHGGFDNFNKATLKNAISAVAAVFSLLQMIDYSILGDTICNWKGSFRAHGNYIKDKGWEC